MIRTMQGGGGGEGRGGDAVNHHFFGLLRQVRSNCFIISCESWQNTARDRSTTILGYIFAVHRGVEEEEEEEEVKKGLLCGRFPCA